LPVAFAREANHCLDKKKPTLCGISGQITVSYAVLHTSLPKIRKISLHLMPYEVKERIRTESAPQPPFLAEALPNHMISLQNLFLTALRQWALQS
jgi:hypothetical protein